MNPLHPKKTTTTDDGVAEDDILVELGYVAVYQRDFRSLENMCMVISLTSGWIIPNVLMLPEVLAVAELASSMPVNGSFYWWAGALAPPAWSHAVSFITGWLNVLTMFASTAAFAYAVSTSFSYVVTIAVPGMVWTDAQMMVLSLAVIVVWGALMTLNLEGIAFVYISMGKDATSSLIFQIEQTHSLFSLWNKESNVLFKTLAILVLVQAVMLILGLPISHAIKDEPFASA
ncbi:hypothetical protein AbraIFM66950_004302 [Aspergillus brasiliensis]|nr:hypothetical protein AbraIFM66950_004302 [Aspergillus brasiliensis]